VKPVPGAVGCSDGGCIFGHPGGMHTNGGCNCLRAIPTKDRIKIVRNIMAMWHHIDDQTARYARLKTILHDVRNIIASDSVEYDDISNALRMIDEVLS
jgi:hypothetical protein